MRWAIQTLMVDDDSIDWHRSEHRASSATRLDALAASRALIDRIHLRIAAIQERLRAVPVVAS